jgi:hypothetical protein
LQLLPAAARSTAAPADGRFTPVNLSRHFNASAAEIGSGMRARALTGAAEDGLIRAASGEVIAAKPQGARIQVLEREKAWVHGQVLDAATRKPTPVRIAFRSRDGRYIPPCGHRTEINPAWFQDYGTDVKIGSSQFAYVDGTFQIELPVGDVYVEISKGFEYRPVRQRLNIAASRRELTLELPRPR